MASRNAAPPLLDEANAAFIEGGVSIVASSSTRENVPVMARAVACRVSLDRRSVTLLFTTQSAQGLLNTGIRSGKQIAVVFSQASTHHTIQLKGKDAVETPPQKRDIKLSERYCDNFVTEICPLGYAEPLVRALLWFDPNELTAVTFTPTDAFLQTPGPRAGEPLKSVEHAKRR
jgi:hypothetical protein